MPFKRLRARLTDFLFIHFCARRAALKLRSFLPLIGMTEGESLVIASPGATCGQTYLFGFTTPVFQCEVFLKKDGGWVAEKFLLTINSSGELQVGAGDGCELLPMSYSDPRARPVLEFLKSIWFAWPYTVYMSSTQEQIKARTPGMRA